MFQKKCENVRTHSLCSLFFFENRAVKKIMSKNMVEPSRPQMTIWRMRIAYWLPKPTNTQSEYVIRIAFPFQNWLQERTSVSRSVYIASLVSKSGELFEMYSHIVMAAILFRIVKSVDLSHYVTSHREYLLFLHFGRTLPTKFAVYKVVSKIFRTGAAIYEYTAVVVARSAGPNRPNCEFRFLL
jgi:hypothetical protein